MHFRYFQGPMEDMDDLIEEKTICSICGKYDHCFDLKYANTNLFTHDEKEDKAGCYECLQSGLFEFWHDTEIGHLDENGLQQRHKYDSVNTP